MFVCECACVYEFVFGRVYLSFKLHNRKKIKVKGWKDMEIKLKLISYFNPHKRNYQNEYKSKN